MQTALSIGGSDPTGGAGLQADLQVFRSLGVHGMGVVTALTIQDSIKVHSTLPAFPSVVLDQLRRLLQDIQPGAVKTGMLASDDVLRSVSLGLRELPETVPLVMDPVLAASDGTILLEERAWPALKELMQRTTLVTPNLAETQLLTGIDASTRAGSEAAAKVFTEDFGAGAALVKGGHREGRPDDLLAIRSRGSTSFTWLEAERVEVGPVHGTGCTLAAAITAELAQGRKLTDAVASGREFLLRALRSAAPLGRGAHFLVYPE
ncbi:MAG: bifunctional hydroxymethylpyrimidine kinase/phosphomethylpyrimidine kinase [Myxococcota bacterium]